MLFTFSSDRHYFFLCLKGPLSALLNPPGAKTKKSTQIMNRPASSCENYSLI